MMFKNQNVYLLKISILLLAIMSLSTNNFYLLWFIMEIMTIIYISILIMSNTNKMMSILYYFISFLSSSLIIINLIMINKYYLNLMLLNLMLKMSLFPFHSWFNFMNKLMSYKNMYLLMTFMKLPPFQLMYLFLPMNFTLLNLIIINLIMPPLLSINKNSIKLIISNSSIYQTSIMIMYMYMNYNLFLTYFMLYSILTMILLIKLKNLNNKNNMNFLMNSLNYKLSLFMNLIMYSYLPPMMTFMMKWSLLENLIMNTNYNYMYMITFFIFSSSIIMTWNYLSFMNNNMYNYMYNKMFFNYKKMNNWMYYIFNSMFYFSSAIYLYFNFI